MDQQYKSHKLLLHGSESLVVGHMLSRVQCLELYDELGHFCDS